MSLGSFGDTSPCTEESSCVSPVYLKPRISRLPLVVWLRILVTGSSCFLGSTLVPSLAADGHIVRAASRSPNRAAIQAGVEWVTLPDLKSEFDREPLIASMDVVVHLAAIACRNLADGEGFAQANFHATASLAHARRRQAIGRLIFMSSIGAQAGSAVDDVITETDQSRPKTAYDRAKLAAEEEIRRSDARHTILRPIVVYGPAAKANIALIMNIAALPLPLPFGALRSRRSLLAIDNLVHAVKVCIANPETMNQTFIVCDREPITLAEILVTLREAAGRSPRLFPMAAVKAMLTIAGRSSLWDRIGRELVASSDKLQKAGWSPPIETRAGLQAMVSANMPCARSD